jgi:hypothetical protein
LIEELKVGKLGLKEFPCFQRFSPCRFNIEDELIPDSSITKYLSTAVDFFTGTTEIGYDATEPKLSKSIRDKRLGEGVQVVQHSNKGFSGL